MTRLCVRGNRTLTRRIGAYDAIDAFRARRLLSTPLIFRAPRPFRLRLNNLRPLPATAIRFLRLHGVSTSAHV